jgi:hypothetical protein
MGRPAVTVAMTHTLVWIEDPEEPGWSCSHCSWKFPAPTILRDRNERRAYDRLAGLKFQEHVCQVVVPPVEIENTSSEPSFTKLVMKFVKVGYKPKDAVDVALDEIALEHRNDTKAMAQARAEAQDFLRKVREGLI